MRKPDFTQMRRVLRREKPDRPVLFELFMNMPLYELVNGRKLDTDDRLSVLRFTAEAYARMGYDYVTAHASAFAFPAGEHARKKSISLNEGAVITSWAEYERYVWPEPSDFDDSAIAKIAPFLPEGLKLMVMGPGGVLENVISLVGYDNLCLLLYDEPELVQAVFDRVGERLVRYYEAVASLDTVGFLCSNDDWGFNTQTFLPPDAMRKYVFPWHKRIVETAHRADKPVMLHSCGNFRDVIDDTVALGYDAKHSYEDNILPVEQAYDAWHSRIAILGGIDVNFICRETPENVYRRSAQMLERAKDGAYALGTGNSVPVYIPTDNFFAMLRAATEE